MCENKCRCQTDHFRWPAKPSKPPRCSGNQTGWARACTRISYNNRLRIDSLPINRYRTVLCMEWRSFCLAKRVLSWNIYINCKQWKFHFGFYTHIYFNIHRVKLFGSFYISVVSACKILKKYINMTLSNTQPPYSRVTSKLFGKKSKKNKKYVKMKAGTYSGRER